MAKNKIKEDQKQLFTGQLIINIENGVVEPIKVKNDSKVNLNVSILKRIVHTALQVTIEKLEIEE